MLVRPSVWPAENVGAAARVLRNFGHADWVLVDPERLDLDVARRMAVGAEDLLDGGAGRARARRRRSPTAPGWWAPSPAGSGAGRRSSPSALAGRGRRPRRGARRRSSSAGSGTGSAPGSWRAATRSRGSPPARRSPPSTWPRPSPSTPSRSAPAPGAAPRAAGAPAAAADDAELLRVEEALREALAAGGFLRGPERHAVRDLSRTLRRARLTRKESRLWIAALRRVARKGERVNDVRPRRSALYVPGANARALAKVGRARRRRASSWTWRTPSPRPPRRRPGARRWRPSAAGLGRAEMVLRVNGRDDALGGGRPGGGGRRPAPTRCCSPRWTGPEVGPRGRAAPRAPPVRPASLALWAMIETPRGVLRAAEVAPRVAAARLPGGRHLGPGEGPAGAPHPGPRPRCWPALSIVVLAARASGPRRARRRPPRPGRRRRLRRGLPPGAGPGIRRQDPHPPEDHRRRQPGIHSR